MGDVASQSKGIEPFHMQEHANDHLSTTDSDAPRDYVELGSLKVHPEPCQSSIHHPRDAHISLQCNIDYVEYKSSGDGLHSSARLTDDGRISISLDLKKTLPDLPEDHAKDVREFALDHKKWNEVPSMNILIMIVGSRGAVRGSALSAYLFSII